jgi:hypothetical protein
MKKISEERFDADPARVVAYVRRSGATVIVYNQAGPVALLTLKTADAKRDRSPRIPRSARTLPTPPTLAGDPSLNEGGVWRLDPETIKELKKPSWRRKLARLSPAGILKMAAALPFLAVVKS